MHGQVLEEFYSIFGPELKSVTGDEESINDVLLRVDFLVEPIEQVGGHCLQVPLILLVTIINFCFIL